METRFDSRDGKKLKNIKQTRTRRPTMHLGGSISIDFYTTSETISTDIPICFGETHGQTDVAFYGDVHCSRNGINFH